VSRATDPLALDYRVGLLRYLSQRGEAALMAGYDLGRRAVEEGTGVLDVVRVHHEVLAGVVRDVAAEPDGDPAAVVEAGAQFLLEVLATVDMAQRAIRPDADPPGV
jgi:hypothetical protein